MSDLEKETYAWMGISPLVKLGRELKNPKTAIVNIVPIGTLPPEMVEQNGLVPEMTVDREIVADDVEPEEKLELPPIEPPTVAISTHDLAIQITTDVFSPEESESVPPVDESPQSEPLDLVEISVAEDMLADIPEHRRRKRRSSATVD
jgi:ribonuclease E